MERKNFLLVDTLPYEIPILYSNAKYASHVCDVAKRDDEWKVPNLDLKDVTTPFQFNVWKNDFSQRKLDLLHPLSQLQMFRFIELYDLDFINYCNNHAIFSIRYPSGINSQTRKYQEKLKDELEFILDESRDYVNNEFEIFVDSYFKKEKFSKITGFYSSHFFKKLETKYQLLLRLDIKSCYENIYTHSLDWAYLGDKELAKKYKSGEQKRFSAKLDRLMQLANYGETNGIVVGPEFSRCVAEIVLMRVDYLVYNHLQEKGKYFKRDYEVVRYVDDIFIFSNDMRLNEEIQRLYDSNLRYFKMDINEAKTVFERRPFLRKGTWVSKMRQIIDKHFKKYKEIIKKQVDANMEESDTPLDRIGKVNVFNKTNISLIDDIRSVIVDYENESEKIVSYLFTSYEKQLKKLFEAVEDKDEGIKNYLLFALIDVLHYSLTLSITTPHVVKFVLFATKIYAYASRNNMVEVINLLYKKCYELARQNTNMTVEMLNLILFMRRFKKDLPEEVLLRFLEQDSGYFTLSCILFYLSATDKRHKYRNTKKLLNQKIEEIADLAEDRYFRDHPGLNARICKDFLLSDLFYPIHDFYSHQLLTDVARNKIRNIINKVKSMNYGSGETLMFRVFWEYVKDFDKPFMRFDISDEELAPLVILKSSKKFEPKISG